MIAKRDEEESAKKQEVLNKAREDIDKFYEDYNDKKQKAIEENRYSYSVCLYKSNAKPGACLESAKTKC